MLAGFHLASSAPKTRRKVQVVPEKPDLGSDFCILEIAFLLELAQNCSLTELSETFPQRMA
jgi:hypothetical protein